ncbi:hypothetical protein BRC86_02525 [Halobacteriales archaeon QS_3_64_16]|nr:MAG: hypothetical protein BRC86_02525 [Halobacteriales archaeon QS_3_64_16]
MVRKRSKVLLAAGTRSVPATSRESGALSNDSESQPSSARAIDEHRTDIYLPPKFTFVFMLLFVLGFGVFWEVLEFAVGGLGTALGATVLTQYGLEDTMLDLVFDLIGAVIVATWGGARLSGVVEALAARLDVRVQRSGEE